MTVEKRPGKTEGGKVSRRKVLLGTAGVLVGAPLVVILVKNSRNKAESLTLQFTGPFDYSQLVPFEAPEHSPVDVDYIRFAEKVQGNYLCLGFTFTGKEDPRRVIDLTIQAKDSSGKVIANQVIPCHDARLNKPPVASTNVVSVCRVNLVNADLNGIKPEQIAMLQVKFSQM